MPRAARADQRGPVEIEVDARVGSHSSAPRLAGLMTVGRRGLNRDGAKGTGHRPITLSSSPPPSPSPLQPSRSPIVRAMRLAGPGWAMQTYAGRASPSKIPGWIESHAIRQRMHAKLAAAPTDPRDPDPDPGVLNPLWTLTAGRFCFGINKNLSVAAFGQAAQARARAASS